MSRVFTNGAGDQNLITGQVIPKTQKMVLNSALLNTQFYKVKEMEWRPPLYLVVIPIKKGSFGSPSTMVANFTLKRAIGLMSWVFAKGPGDRGSFPDRVIPKILKMVACTALLNT